MKRIRIWIRAEYELPEGSELVEVTGEPAIKLGEHFVKPTLEFLQLRDVKERISTWSEADEEVYDSVLAAEKGFFIDLVQDG
ncbi:hypothetical protein, partial [Luteimonas lutimaris]|uniref:hypothetical protein n=1 Tax=Luteimonas lutimaris TaxID=698645 RepID=UPI0031E220A5